MIDHKIIKNIIYEYIKLKNYCIRVIRLLQQHLLALIYIYKNQSIIVIYTIIM